MVSEISGKFVNDILEGEIMIDFIDNTRMISYAHSGYLMGPQRYFDTYSPKENGGHETVFLNFTDSKTGLIYLKKWKIDEENSVTIFGCSQNVRCIIMTNDNYDNLKSCILVTRNFFVNCFSIKNDIPEIELNNCTLDFATPKKNAQTYDCSNCVNMIITPEKSIEKSKMQSNLDCPETLSSWLNGVQNPNLFWYHFNENYEPLNLENPEIEIEIGYLQGRDDWGSKSVFIKSPTDNLILFKGNMQDGKLKGKVDKELANHPAWRSRLTIVITDIQQFETYVKEGPLSQLGGLRSRELGHEMYIRGSFKNGKLHGLVQMYGKFTADPKGHCSSKLFSGLSYIGWFEEGKATGPSWRSFVGDTYIYGNLDENGDFTGPDIAFIYQDLELALVGQFNKGMMVSKYLIFQIKDRSTATLIYKNIKSVEVLKNQGYIIQTF